MFVGGEVAGVARGELKPMALGERGVHMRHIQAILGHSSTSVTEIYSHLAPEALDRTMEETFGE